MILPTKRDPGYQYAALSTFSPKRFEVETRSFFPEALSLEEAEKKFAPYLQSRKVRKESDPMAALAWQSQEGHFISIAAGTKRNLSYTLTSGTARTHIVLGAGAELRLTIASATPNALNSLLDIHLDRNATLDIVHLMDHEPDSWHFFALRATLKRDANLTYFHHTYGSTCDRSDLSVDLLEENSACDLSGLWTLKGKTKSHTNVLVSHRAPHCSSRQNFRGVLSDSTLSSFEGKIYVEKEAQQTDAYQLNNNLLLGEFARANSRPNLEIFADDVKASHGSTTGQIDAKALFYLRSRGISESRAKQMIARGFCEEMAPFPMLERIDRGI